MFVNKWYCWVIGLTIIAAGVTIPVAVYFALDASDACSTEDTSTCTATKGNCTNIESTWKCDCKEGYMNAAGDTQTCEDINECSTGDTSSCEADKGSCINMESTWRCECKEGYRNTMGNTQACEDIDECIDGDTSSCEAGKGNCMNMDSTWKCDCNDGCRNAVGDPQTCVDLNECIDGDTSSCEAGKGKCVNMVSTWKCDCNDGYRNADGDMQTCEDVDECIKGDTSSCEAGKGNCVNLNSTWKCDCNKGYRNAAGDMHICEVAECGNKTETSPGEGSLVFPGNGISYYESNDYCIWILTAPPGKILTLTFSMIHIGYHSSCAYDYLEIHDSSMEETGLLGKFCGDQLPGDNGVLTTNLNEIRLVFRSDEYENFKGFALTWASVEDQCAAVDTTSCVPSTGMCQSSETTWVCGCNQGYANPDGDMKTCVVVECGNKTETSPGEGSLVFPGNGIPYYKSNDYCFWILTASPGKVLTLTFSKIHIEYHSSCAYDYLEIHDPSMEETGFLGRFCADQLPGDNGVITTFLNEIRLVFRSDEYENFEGFALTWTSVEDHCAAADTTSCVPSTGMCQSSETTWVCVCNRGYANPDGDIKTCIPVECGKKTETSPGEGSLVFPGNGIPYYESNDYCVWILTAPPGKVLTLTFSKIHIEHHSSCEYDYLEIHDPSMEETGLQGRFCGDQLPGDNGVITTFLNEIRLLFSSDETENFEGFALTWTSVEDHCAAADTTSCVPSIGMCQNSETTWVCGCNRGYANPNGDIKTCILAECGNKTETSPGEGSLVFPGNGIPYYESNSYCIWILTAPPGKVLTLTFSIHIEHHSSCAYDYLEIHDPSMEETGLLGRFCGDQLHGYNRVFTTDLNELRLVFRSDETENFEGFALTWTSE